MKTSLLQFFREGTFHGVKPGDSRGQVVSILGPPDLHYPGHSKSPDMMKAGLWYYAGVQFSFIDLDNDLLDDIGFKPFYLKSGQKRDLETEKTELDLWIFAREDEPTIQDLKDSLASEGILFQDTGLESIVFNKAKKNFEIIPYDPNAEESFGTLVLKSGIQVRYLDNDEIIRIQIGGESWMYKGKEQHITW